VKDVRKLWIFWKTLCAHAEKHPNWDISVVELFQRLTRLPHFQLRFTIRDSLQLNKYDMHISLTIRYRLDQVSVAE